MCPRFELEVESGTAVNPGYLARPRLDGVGGAGGVSTDESSSPFIFGAMSRKGARLGSRRSLCRSALSRRSTSASTEAFIAPRFEGSGRLAEEATEFCVSSARRRLAPSMAVWAAADSAIEQAISSARTAPSKNRTAARSEGRLVIWWFLLAASVAHCQAIDVE